MMSLTGANTDSGIPLSDLLSGDRGKISSMDFPSEKRGRILEMGLTVGAIVEVVRFAPLGDPMEIKVRGSHLTLRKADAREILMQRI